MTTLTSSEKASVDAKDSEKQAEVHIALVTDEVDTGAQLVAGTQTLVDHHEALRVRRKIDWHIMPLMCSAYNLWHPVSTVLMYLCDSDILGTVYGQAHSRKCCDLGVEVCHGIK